MNYIGKERAFKRMSARIGSEKMQIDERTHNKVDIEHLLDRVDLLSDEFLIYYFKTVDDKSIILSSKRVILFDNELSIQFIAIEDIKEVKFNQDFKLDLESTFPIILGLHSQSSLTISMVNGPEGIALVNAISDIRRIMYE